MENEYKLFGGAMVTIALAISALVVVPYMQLSDIEAPEGVEEYSSAELRGRQQYIANGCEDCHTQQPRAREQDPDAERGWGRTAGAADYYYDTPHLVGQRRTGPDVLTIGV